MFQMALSEKSTQMAWTANLCSSLISKSCQEITKKKDTNSTNCMHREQKCLRCIWVTEDITRALPTFTFTSFCVHDMGWDYVCNHGKRSCRCAKQRFPRFVLLSPSAGHHICLPNHSICSHIFILHLLRKLFFFKATKENNRANNRMNKWMDKR